MIRKLRNIENRFRMLVLTLVYLIILANSVSANSIDNNILEHLVVLENAKVQVGVLPEVGGRVVLFRLKGNDNIFKSDPNLWQNSQEKEPELPEFSKFKSFNGHIVWLGPQTEWWTRQDKNKTRKKRKALWPPDPYIIYGDYNIVEKTNNYLKMRGPKSPISGIRLTKEIKLENSGTVIFSSKAENIADTTVCWDLWMNTRMNGFAKCFVPVKENSQIELIKDNTDKNEVTPYKIIDNYLTLFPAVPENNKLSQSQEFHIVPADNYIAGVDGNQMLIIQFEMLDDSLIHPYHSQVELYSHIGKTRADNLLELEVHGEYKTLKPGQKMYFQEAWNLIKVKKKASQKEYIKLLNKIKEEL